MINRIRYRLRRFEYLFRINKLSKIKNKKVLVFQTPLHKNLGDHLIAVALIKFLKNIGIQHIFEIPNEMFLSNKNKLRRAIADNDIIIITGGGFIGNIWTREETVLEEILKTFPDNKVIIFPQTIWFEKDKPSYEQELNDCKKLFENHKKLVLFVREGNSYNFVKDNFRNINVTLAPDIALSYQPANENSENKHVNVGFCLRNDVEKFRNETIICSIKNILEDCNEQIVYTDTMSKNRVYEHDRERFVIDKIKEFSQYKLVVTDRLHGMIFAYLAGTPCIVLDNKTKKVTGVYVEWLKECENIIPVLDGVDRIIVEFIHKALSNKLFMNDAPLDIKYFEYLKEVCLEYEK